MAKATSAVSPPMTPARRIPMSKFRDNLSAVMKRNVAQDKEHVIVESGGLPVGVVIAMDDYEDYLDLVDPAMNAHVAQGIKDFAAGKATRTRDLLADIQVRRPKAKPRRK